MTVATALPDFLAELQKNTAGELRSDEYSRILYSTDASIYQVMPHGVLLPMDADDIHAAVSLANRYNIPLLPRTGGSSLAGQAVNEALVMDMSRHMRQVLEVNSDEHWVRVQPGIVLDELNLYLKPYGLKFGPDPASSGRAAMGGIVSNNSTGAHSILYGMTADHVLECKGFLSDGSPFHFKAREADSLEFYMNKSGLEGQVYRDIFRITEENAAVIAAGTPKHWRRCGGYNLDRFLNDNSISSRIPRDKRFNLAKLICGAEGTLAVITEIKLNLVPLPKKAALAMVHFDSLQAALEAVPDLLESEPSAIELLDNLCLTLCEEVPEYARLITSFVEGRPDSILIVEYYDEDEKALRSRIDKLEQRLRRRKIGTHMVPAFSDQLQSNVWTVRKVGLGLLMSIKGDFKPIPFIEDAAVPPEHLAEYIRRIEQFCKQLDTRVAYYAHASAGCLHVRPLINAKVAADIEKLPQIAAFSAELVGQYGGSLSSEHGDGRTRSWLNERFYGKELYGLFKAVKQSFDPQNLLNPGNIVNGGDMTENLRYGETYQTVAITEHLDFSADEGFKRAVEMCNGAGVCRKMTHGTMCPSFMVTREEEHSTRGRANALRAAISGKLPQSELTSKRMYQVMDLCVECKACKAECPSSVDMAKIKMQFLAEYYRKNGTPLRARIFAGMPRMNRLMSGPLAGISNWKLNNRFFKKSLEKMLGISSERTLPALAKESFTKWYRRHRNHKSALQAEKRVVLFNDTFNTYNDPHIAVAALEVLEAAGYQVILPGHRCCGRPMISKGLLQQARKAAADTVAKLAPYARQGLPIIGLEPGCLLALRDEYHYLLPDNPDVQLIADNSLMFEEFIEQLADKGELADIFDSNSGKILLHGHCHQKALVGTKPSRQTLELTGCAVEEVDSGCCGMAGSFGYEAEHLDISLRMGERRLFPAVRQQADDTLIAAAGTSCRHQIKHGTGRDALHPAEILRNALKKNRNSNL